MTTSKVEVVYATEHDTLENAAATLSAFIDNICNATDYIRRSDI